MTRFRHAKHWLAMLVKNKTEYESWHQNNEDWFVRAGQSVLQIRNMADLLKLLIENLNYDESLDSFFERLRFIGPKIRLIYD